MEHDFAELVGTAQRPTAASNTCNPIPLEQDRNLLASLGAGRSWAASDNNFMPIGESHESLPSGMYSCHMSNQGPFISKMANNIDLLVDLPDSESERLLDEIVQFRDLKESFAQHGFLYKRGIMLWGPPGSGKTVTIQQLLKLFVTDGGGIAVIINNPEIATQCMQVIRKIEPERQILAILEDLDALIDRHGEAHFLALLDGESQLQNVCYVATTNYPERLDKRFVDRPSRFDTIRYIGMPSGAARRAYLAAKVPTMKDDALDVYVEETDGFSIAYMREVIVLTQCFKLSRSEAISRLRQMHKVAPKSSDGDKSSFGFGS